ncbi:aryl hydrocarbon receptor [Columba livia]|uniref:Aryl hydrocarbon receptor n=1 Tax=Columba livia TaxID=8932 RepID=A0A2I0MIF5_COLLI|nr:aryl hydrocarbon receptor [Columba livia]
MIFRTKHKLDFTPLACDAKGKIVLGYTEAELRMCGTGYQFVHAADMLYCAENHVRMMKTGESGLTVFRLLTKEKRWKWVQANARLVYKNGKPEYIIVTQRPLVDEEGGEHLRKRSMHLPFTFATGEALLYQSAYPLPGFPDPFQSKGKTSKPKKTSHSHRGRSQKDGVDPSSLLGAVMRQDKAVYVSHPAPTPNCSCSSSCVDHLGDISLLDARGDGWSVGTAPASLSRDSLKEELVDSQQEDPLLATLDSLSIKSDESCSNNELFSALEGLGLNAEDLELLLLDEKMVMVNMDPDRTPSQNNCLTSNEILSYIHTTLANKHEGGQQVCPLPGTSLSPCGGTTAYQAHVEDEDSQYVPQHVVQPSITPGQPPAQLWEQPLHTMPGQPPPPLQEPAEEEGEMAEGLEWRPAGEDGLLLFLQLAQGNPWDKAPGSPPGTSCPQDPPRARQLEGGFPAMHPTQEDARQSFSLHSQCQGGPPSQPKQHHLIPEKQPSASVPQHPFPSSSAECFRSISSLLETPVNSYGTYASALSRESRHRQEPLRPDSSGMTWRPPFTPRVVWLNDDSEDEDEEEKEVEAAPASQHEEVQEHQLLQVYWESFEPKDREGSTVVVAEAMTKALTYDAEAGAALLDMLVESEISTLKQILGSPGPNVRAESFLQLVPRYLQSNCSIMRSLVLKGLTVICDTPWMVPKMRFLVQRLTDLLQDTDMDMVRMTLSVLSKVIQGPGFRISTPIALQLAQRLQPLFDNESWYVRHLSVSIFKEVIERVPDDGKKPLKTLVHQSLLPLIFHVFDENKAVAATCWGTLLRATPLLKKEKLRQAVAKDQRIEAIGECLLVECRSRAAEYLRQTLTYMQSPQDSIREAAVAFLGVLGQHMRAQPEKFRLIYHSE